MSIFNTEVPQSQSTHLAKLLSSEQTLSLIQRVKTTQKTNMIEPLYLDPETCQRVGNSDTITITSGRASGQPLQKGSHVISNDTEIIPPATHPYDGNPIKSVHKYRTHKETQRNGQPCDQHHTTHKNANLHFPRHNRAPNSRVLVNHKQHHRRGHHPTRKN